MTISLLTKINKNRARRLRSSFRIRVAERNLGGAYAATGSTPALTQRSKRRMIVHNARNRPAPTPWILNTLAVKHGDDMAEAAGR
jgi:hypothetical protein